MTWIQNLVRNFQPQSVADGLTALKQRAIAMIQPVKAQIAKGISQIAKKTADIAKRTLAPVGQSLSQVGKRGQGNFLNGLLNKGQELTKGIAGQIAAGLQKGPLRGQDAADGDQTSGQHLYTIQIHIN